MQKARRNAHINQLSISCVSFAYGLFDETEHLIEGITVRGEQSEGGISHDVVDGRDHYSEESASNTFHVYLGDPNEGLCIEIDRAGCAVNCRYNGKPTTWAWYKFRDDATLHEQEDGSVLASDGQIMVHYVDGKAVFAGNLKDGKPHGLCGYFRDGYFITEGGYYEDGVLTDKYRHFVHGEALPVDPIPADLEGYFTHTEALMLWDSAGGGYTKTSGYFKAGALAGFGEVLTKEYNPEKQDYDAYIACGVYENGVLVWGSRYQSGAPCAILDFVDGVPAWYKEEKLTIEIDGEKWLYVGEVRDGKPHGIGVLTAFQEKYGERKSVRATWVDGVTHGIAQTCYIKGDVLQAGEPIFTHHGGYERSIERFIRAQK
jgi:hypothetical protein